MAVRNGAASSDYQDPSGAAPAASDRRGFLRSTLVAGSAAAPLVGLAGNHVSMARAQGLRGRRPPAPGTTSHPASDKTVHWGYFSKSLAPVVEVDSGDFVTIETLTHHANDDASRMIQGDPGAESVYSGMAAGRASTAAAPVRWTRPCSVAAPARVWACTS